MVASSTRALPVTFPDALGSCILQITHPDPASHLSMSQESMTMLADVGRCPLVIRVRLPV